MHKMHEQRDKLYNVPTYYTKFLKYDLFWHQIEGIRNVQLENNLVRVKSKVYLMPWIIISHPPLVVTPNWCGEKGVAKTSKNWKNKAWFLSRHNAFFMVMERIPLENLVMAKRRAIPRICAI
jgi:hypothetical protein